jgi:hypothetical protein
MSAVLNEQPETAAPPQWNERRLIGRALSEWESLRAGRAFPSCVEFDNTALPDNKANVFVVEVGKSEAEDRIIRAGRRFIEALGLNPVGRRAMDVLPSAERRLSFCHTVVRFQKPLADIGRFTNVRGDDVWYRCILLPTSTDQIRVNHVVGAFSFKVVQ